MALLKVRDPNTGNIIEIPGIKGDAGKSAYQYAKEGGYTGTEAEFMTLLVEVASKAPFYGYGTDDLVAGTTPLETGRMYFVYE